MAGILKSHLDMFIASFPKEIKRPGSGNNSTRTRWSLTKKLCLNCAMLITLDPAIFAAGTNSVSSSADPTTNMIVEQSLRAGLYEWPPYYIYEGEGVAGIGVDLMQEVSARTGFKTTCQPLPTKRMRTYFREGTLTFEPTCSPAWREDDKDISCYTIPYMQSTNVVLMKKESGIKATSPKDLKGKVLGCDFGYFYTDGFDTEFKNGSIIREDVSSGAKANIQKLAANRVDAVIVDQAVERYWIKQLKMNPDDFEEVYIFKAGTALSIRLHISQKALLPALNKAIEAMKADGTIEKIIEKHTK
jgi:polar amino acid transport system substrate-binding protein